MTALTTAQETPADELVIFYKEGEELPPFECPDVLETGGDGVMHRLAVMAAAVPELFDMNIDLGFSLPKSVAFGDQQTEKKINDLIVAATKLREHLHYCHNVEIAPKYSIEINQVKCRQILEGSAPSLRPYQALINSICRLPND